VRNGRRNGWGGISAPQKAVSIDLHLRSTTADRLTTAGGSARRRNSPSTPPRSQIAANGCITAGGGRSSIAAAGVSGGAAVPTCRPCRPAAAGRLTSGRSGRRHNSPSTPPRNQIAACGCITAGGGRSSITAAGVPGGAAVRTRIARRPAAAGRLTAGGSGRRRNSLSTPFRNYIAAGGCIIAGGGRSSIAAAGVAGGAAVPTGGPRRPAAAGRLTAGGHTGAGHIPVASLLGDHVVQDGHRFSDGDHLFNGGELGRVQSHMKTCRKHGIQPFDIFTQSFLKSVKCMLYFCRGVRKRRDEQRKPRINTIHKIIQERAGRAVSSVRKCTGRPFSVCNG